MGGSGALIATISAAYAFSPSHEDKQNGNMYSKRLVVHMEPGIHIESVPRQKRDLLLEQAIQKSRSLCMRVKEEKGLPGLTVGVTLNGKLVWQEG